MRAGLERRKAPVERLDDVIRLDARRRELLPEVESLRATQNKASEAIAQAKRSGEDAAVMLVAPARAERHVPPAA